jgi:hypothetical protein
MIDIGDPFIGRNRLSSEGARVSAAASDRRDLAHLVDMMGRFDHPVMRQHAALDRGKDMIGGDRATLRCDQYPIGRDAFGDSHYIVGHHGVVEPLLGRLQLVVIGVHTGGSVSQGRSSSTRHIFTLRSVL